MSELESHPGKEPVQPTHDRAASASSRLKKTIAVSWLTGIFGILSGYALYVLWWEETDKRESGWTFFGALLVAALMSFVFEFLRGAIQGEEEPWSESRVLTTVAMLAAFELFVIAFHGAFEEFRDLGVIGGFIFGDASTTNPGWSLAVLGLLWIVVALTIVSRLRTFVLRWPYPDSNAHPRDSLGGYLSAMAPDLFRGAWVGLKAGVFWGVVAAVAYVFLFRAFFLAQWIHEHYSDWTASLAAQSTGRLPGIVAIFLYGPPFLAGLFAKYLGGIGLVAGVVIVTLMARGLASRKNRGLATIWPSLTLLIVLGSPIFTDPVQRHNLVVLAYVSALIWGVPAMLLGALAPFLRRPSHNPSVWGLVAAAAAAVMAVATMARFFEVQASPAEKLLLTALTLGLLLLAFQLFRGDWLEEYWLLIALSIGTIIWGTTSLVQKASILQLQRNAGALISLPLGVQQTSASFLDEIAVMRLFSGKTTPRLDSGVYALLPPGEKVSYLANACAAELSWTPEHRAQFASDVEAKAQSNQKLADADQGDVSRYAAQLDTFEMRARQVIAEESQELSGPAAEQFEEIKRRGDDFAALDQPGQDLEKWTDSTPQSVVLFSVATETPVCQTEIDAPLAHFAVAERARADAEASVASTKTRVKQQLTAEEADLKKARDNLEAARRSLQEEEARRLELAMTSSIGFWVTVGLLAVWRLTEPDREQTE